MKLKALEHALSKKDPPMPLQEAVQGTLQPAMTKLYEQQLNKAQRELVEAMSIGMQDKQQEQRQQAAQGRKRGSAKEIIDQNQIGFER